MKKWKKWRAFLMTSAICLGLSACGSNEEESEDYRAPGVIEGAAYDSAADNSGYEEYFGDWEGVGDARGDTLEITSADGGMYFTLYRDEEVIASGSAQNVPEYAYIYFFNQHDGNAYQFAANYDGDMELYNFGVFVMKTPASSTQEEFEGDSSWLLTDSSEDNPAEQLGYDSIEDMRIQEHEIISSDDMDNMVAEGYWYPDGDRNSPCYFKVQRDTIYWYEFYPEQGDVQVGEADGIVLSFGRKRRLRSGTTFTYTSAWKFENSKICFEGDSTEYYWRER